MAERTDPTASIEELFKCFICLGRVKNAQMCPHCSKMCCMSCIKRWLTEQRPQCPHCRAALRVSQLVNCRFVAEVSAAIDSLTTKKPMVEEAVDLCGLHNAPLNYFCASCSTPVCSDCAMFGQDHKNHDFEHLSSVYEKHVATVQAETSGLRKRLKELSSLMNQVETNIEAVSNAKMLREKDYENALLQMKMRLDAQLKQKLVSLFAQKGAMSEEIELLESLHNELNRQLNKSPRTELIAKSQDLVRMLQEIHAKPTSHFAKGPVSAEFPSELVPPYDSAVFRIKAFTNIKDEVIFSDPLHVNGLTWRLKVYPNGNGLARGACISVFLELLKGLQEQSRYEYRVEMINHLDPSKNVSREFASEFEVGECWGYNRFCRVESLVQEGFISTDGMLVLRYSVRAPSYFQQYRDARRYNQHLEAARAQAALQIAELKQRLAIEVSRRTVEANPQRRSREVAIDCAKDSERLVHIGEHGAQLDVNVAASEKDTYRTNQEEEEEEEDRDEFGDLNKQLNKDEVHADDNVESIHQLDSADAVSSCSESIDADVTDDESNDETVETGDDELERPPVGRHDVDLTREQPEQTTEIIQTRNGILTVPQTDATSLQTSLSVVDRTGETVRKEEAKKLDKQNSKVTQRNIVQYEQLDTDSAISTLLNHSPSETGAKSQAGSTRNLPKLKYRKPLDTLVPTQVQARIDKPIQAMSVPGETKVVEEKKSAAAATQFVAENTQAPNGRPLKNHWSWTENDNSELDDSTLERQLVAQALAAKTSRFAGQAGNLSAPRGSLLHASKDIINGRNPSHNDDNENDNDEEEEEEESMMLQSALLEKVSSLMRRQEMEWTSPTAEEEHDGNLRVTQQPHEWIFEDGRSQHDEDEEHNYNPQQLTESPSSTRSLFAAMEAVKAVLTSTDSSHSREHEQESL